MTEPELTAEEAALLESVSVAQPPAAVEIEKPAADVPTRRPRKPRDEPQIAPGPTQPVDVESEPVERPKGPHDHALAPPAQHRYDDPWGLLPMQMRHDAEGRSIF